MCKAQEERYRIIAFLLQYPEPAWLQMIPQATAYSRRLPAGRTREAMAAFLDYLASQPLMRLQENYTAAFDLNPATTLNMSYHLLGDGRKRAALLAMLAHSYRCEGYEGPAHDLPDFLPAMIEFLAVCRSRAALDPVRRCLAGLDGLVHRLRDAAPAYADLLALLVDDYRQWQASAGEPARSDSAGQASQSVTAPAVLTEMEKKP
jgi:nitrate reductase molybdenum cofactor assembly chaperone NarJ/NarW